MTSAGPNSRFSAHKYGVRSVRIDWDDSRTLHIFQPSTTARAQRQSTPEQPAAGQQAKQHSHRFMQKSRARTRSIHKAAHPKQCTVLYRANGCRGMRAAESGSGEERAAMALTALQCPAPCSVHLCHSCHLSPRCRGGWCPRATQSIRCEHARYARLHRGCCTAHLREEALHADDVLRAAGEENLYQESESSAKMTGSRMGFASRG